MKNGLFEENGELIYYKDDRPKHAGVVKVDGAIYYISSKGRAVRGKHVVHREMTNGILKRGTYTFGEDCKLIAGSYIAPKKYAKTNLGGKIQKEKQNVKRLFARIKAVLKNKKNRTAIGLMIGLAMLLVILPALVSYSERNDVMLPISSSKIVLPTFEEDVLLCSKAAKLEYDGELALKEAVETGVPYRPFVFEYHLKNTSGLLVISESEDLSDAQEYILAEEEKFVTIDNLKVDTTYYYEVRIGNDVYPGSFHTAPATRFVSIPGLINTRDIGGGFNQDGKRVRQGLLIRGVELDGLVNAPYFIPEEELDNVRDAFGFVYDLDLRGAEATYSGDYNSRLGIEHKFYNAPMYGQIFQRSFCDSIRQTFSDLADPNKYPMYLHCTYGTDRTGTIIFLLQGVLNVSEEDMVREYRLTAYYNKNLAESHNMEVIISGLEPYEGDTLQEKIVSFLITEIGVTEEEIEAIRKIFLEP